MSFIDDSERNVNRLIETSAAGGVAGFVGRAGKGIDDLFAGAFHPDSGHGSQNEKLLAKQISDRKKIRSNMEKEAAGQDIELVGNPSPIGGYFDTDTEDMELAYDELFTYDELNIEKSWFIKHADAYSGLEGNYTGSICNETFNCSGVYSNSPSYNLLNFSNINYAIVNDYGDNQHMLSNTWIKCS